MTDPSSLQPIRFPTTPGIARAPAVGTDPFAGPSFADLLANSIKEVNALQHDADQAIQDLTVGKTENVTEVLTAVEKADLAFRALMQIRNKLVDAYEEIQRLRI